MKKNIARLLLDKQAVRLQIREPFTFTSGLKSPIYCDNRKMLAFPKERDIITEAFAAGLQDKGFAVLAGTATAGIPWAAFLADRLALPMAYVRSKKKAHGTAKQIEGAKVQGKKILLVEDLISTGNSCITALKACRREGAEQVEICSIFSYQFAKTFQNFTKAGCSWWSLTDFPTLLNVARDYKMISEEELKIAEQWRDDPENWITY